MDADNCGGRGRAAAAGPGAAELVKEWLNMHLPSPETLIKEERCQVPASRLPLHAPDVHTRAQRSPDRVKNGGGGFCEVLIEHLQLRQN